MYLFSIEVEEASEIAQELLQLLIHLSTEMHITLPGEKKEH